MPLEQNEPRSVKTSAPKRRRRIVDWVVVLLVLPLGAVLLGWYGCWQGQDGAKPPAPDAPEARQWEPSQPEAPVVEPSEDRNLPLEIVIDDIPEIPEEIKGPSPPIEDESEAENPSSTLER